MLARPYLETQVHPRAVGLADGRVLVVDGPYEGEAGTPYTGGELYDPETNAFSLTGAQVPGAIVETLTLLNDGRVLISGASNSPAEIFDPTSGLFSATGRMVDGNREDAARWDDMPGYTATSLNDGRVLIVGGVHSLDHSPVYLRSAELFDPATGKFTATGSLNIAREHHTATLLADGRVLIAGGDQGYIQGNNFIPTAEIYDPAKGTFIPAGAMITPRIRHTATLLPDGSVLIAGGSTGSAELYDPTAGKFIHTGDLVFPRGTHGACLLASGVVLIAGGAALDEGSGLGLGAAELYDPTTFRFTRAATMHQAPGQAEAIALHNGRVLVLGIGQLTPELYWP